MITLSRANVCLYFSVNQDVFDRQHRPEHRGVSLGPNAILHEH